MIRHSLRVKILCMTGCMAVLSGSAARADVLVSNFNSGNIVRYSDSGEFLHVIVPEGSGGLSQPHRSRIGPDGLLYVASAGNNQILRYHAVTGDYLDVFIDGGALEYPVDFLFRDDGYLYVSSQLSNEVLRYDAATGAHDPAYSASNPALNGPSGIAFDDDGNLYVAGRFSDTIARFDSGGMFEESFSGGNFGLVFREDGSLLSVSGSLVLRTENPGTFPAQDTLVGSHLSFPIGLEIGSGGSLYVANYSSNLIQRFDPVTGDFLGTFAGTEHLDGPNYFTFVIPEPGPLALAILAAVFLLAPRWRKCRF